MCKLLRLPLNSLYSAIVLILAIGLSAVLIGCESADGGKSSLDGVNATLKQAKRTARDTVEALSPHTDAIGDLANEEVEKLMKLEYHVHTLANDLSTEELNEQLAELGRQRWDCFDTQAHETGLMIFCKRRPKSYLRYLGKLF